MPSYDYMCTDPNCTNIQEVEAKISEFKDLKPTCIVCGGVCVYHFTPTVVQFALKDGPSGSWPSKGNHFKQYRANQSKKMKRKQLDRYGHLNHDCVPNYGGKITEDWREAQSLAMSDKERQESMGTDSLSVASTYSDKILGEKGRT